MNRISTEKIVIPVVSARAPTDDRYMLLTKDPSDHTEIVAGGWRRSTRTTAMMGAFSGLLLVATACGVPVDSTEPGNSKAAGPDDTAITSEVVDEIVNVPTAPLGLVDDCVEQTMARAFSGEEFWSEHWDNMNQDEGQLRQWCDQYGVDDPAGLVELSREWQERAAEVPDSGTVAPPSIVPLVDPVVASTVPAPPATTATPPPAASSNVSYANCAAVRAAGAAPIRRGDPGYSSKLDRDGDGIGCE